MFILSFCAENRKSIHQFLKEKPIRSLQGQQNLHNLRKKEKKGTFFLDLSFSGGILNLIMKLLLPIMALGLTLGVSSAATLNLGGPPTGAGTAGDPWVYNDGITAWELTPSSDPLRPNGFNAHAESPAYETDFIGLGPDGRIAFAFPATVVPVSVLIYDSEWDPGNPAPLTEQASVVTDTGGNLGNFNMAGTVSNNPRVLTNTVVLAGDESQVNVGLNADGAYITVDFEYRVIPEPSTAMFGLVGLALGLVRRRR